MRRVSYRIDIERIAVTGAAGDVDAPRLRDALGRALSQEFQHGPLPVRPGERTVARVEVAPLSGVNGLVDAVAAAVGRAARSR